MGRRAKKVLGTTQQNAYLYTSQKPNKMEIKNEKAGALLLFSGAMGGMVLTIIAALLWQYL